MRDVPKCKRAHRVYDRDFIVVDDISGVLKMRSQCAIDGYGFLSSNGDPRNPQEIPPDIREDMAAWPDARPISQATFVPEPAYVYFVINYEVVSATPMPGYGISELSAGATVCFDAPLAGCDWYVDGVLAASGINVTLTLSGGNHTLRMDVTDTQGHTGTATFTYYQVYLPHSAQTFIDAAVVAGDGVLTLTNTDRTLTIAGATVATTVQGIGAEQYTAGKWFFAFQITGDVNTSSITLIADDYPAYTYLIAAQALGIDPTGIFLGGAIDPPSSGTQLLGNLLTGDQFILFFDADLSTWGIVTPDDVSHDLTALTKNPLANRFGYQFGTGPTGMDITILLTSELTLTAPVGYNNAAEP